MLPTAPEQPKPECFYRMREDSLIERVDPVTGRVLAVFSDFNKEADIANFIETEINGEKVLVQVGLTTPTLVGAHSVRYSQAIADIIFQKLVEEQGMSLTKLCALPGMPSYSAVSRWRKDFKEFDDQIRYARKARAERLRDEAMEIAASANGAFKDDIPGKKLAVETLQWAAAHDDPESYGSKVRVEGSALVALVVETGIRRNSDAKIDVGGSDAIKKGKLQESDISEYQGGDQSGQAAEASGGDSTLEGREVQSEEKEGLDASAEILGKSAKN